VLHIGDLDREKLAVAMLDVKNRVIGLNDVSLGGINSSVVHPREVLKPALLVNAYSIILGHNHPSGDPEPSQEDIDVTKKINKACRLMNIPLLDHIIIGHEGYYSMREKGFLG